MLLVCCNQLPPFLYIITSVTLSLTHPLYHNVDQASHAGCSCDNVAFITRLEPPAVDHVVGQPAPVCLACDAVRVRPDLHPQDTSSGRQLSSYCRADGDGDGLTSRRPQTCSKPPQADTHCCQTIAESINAMAICQSAGSTAPGNTFNGT